MDPEELAKYENTCPTTLDYLSNYRDGVDPFSYMVDTSANATAQLIKVSADGNEVAASGTTAATRVQSFYSYPNNVLACDMNRPAGPSNCHRPRGSFKILRIYGSNDGGDTARAVTAADTTVYIQFRTIEPIFCLLYTSDAADDPTLCRSRWSPYH